MPSSDARISANRRNASKSTGPKTPEGKARSRENAYKHGLTGDGVVLPIEDGAVVAGRFATLQEEFAPTTLMGSILVKRIAMLSVRLDRSYRQEAAALAVRVESARPDRIDARKAEAEHLLRWIGAEPVTNHRRLMEFPEGVDALIVEGEKMKADLDHPGETRWIYTHYHQADYMHGNLSTNIDQSDYMCWTMALNGNDQHIKPEHFQGMNDEAKRLHALERLAGLVDADIARLRAYRATMDTAGRDAELTRAPEVALFDPSKDAILARKYEAAAERGIYRAIQQLQEIEAGEEVEDEEADIPARPPGKLASFFRSESPADTMAPAPLPDIPPAPPGRPMLPAKRSRSGSRRQR